MSVSHCTVRVNVTVPGFLRLFSSEDEEYFLRYTDPFSDKDKEEVDEFYAFMTWQNCV